MSRVRALLALSLVATACTVGMTGALDASGYKHTTYDYRVQPLDAKGTLLPDGWVLDNLYVDEVAPGKPLKPKEAGDYVTKFHFDTNGDGQVDAEEKALVYDLRYEHRVHSGIIWLRTVPLSQKLRDKDLRVLMQEYVDGVAGAGYELVNLDTGNVVLEKRFAAELLTREQGTLGGTAASAAEFAVANVDQVHVSKQARRSRVKVVIARPGFEYALRQVVQGAVPPKYPVLFIAGYASLPEDFSRGVPDFDGLLKRLTFHGKSGLALTPIDSVESDGGAPEPEKASSPVTDEKPAAPDAGSGSEPPGGSG